MPTLNKMNPISLSCFTSRKIKYYPKLWAQGCWHSQLLKTQVPKPSALCWVGNSSAIPSSTPNPLSPSLNFKNLKNSKNEKKFFHNSFGGKTCPKTDRRLLIFCSHVSLQEY